MSDYSAIFKLIQQELDHQEHKWGADRVLHPYLWNTIIGEEVGEANRASLEENDEQYIDELVDVAASAISAIHSVMHDAERQQKEAGE